VRCVRGGACGADTVRVVCSWPRERRRKFFRIAYQVDEEIYSGYHSDTDMTEQQKYEWHCNHRYVCVLLLCCVVR
jgi:hypothetical protein